MSNGDHWLNRERLTVYPRIILLMFIVITIGIIWRSNLVTPDGKPIITDFGIFYSASQIALTGHAAESYDESNLLAKEKVIEGDAEGYYWFYPPTFYLVILPLGLLPFFLSYFLFMLTTFGCYVMVLRRIIWNGDAMWCLAAFSGVWMEVRCGQNGFLTAALAGAALLNLERRPILAGIFIGMLSIKPHLALMFPIALIAIGAWRTFCTAAAVSLIFMTASVAILGFDTFTGYLQNLTIARDLIEYQAGPGYWDGMPTMFAFFRLLGVSVMTAYVAHYLVALGAIAAVWKVWRLCPSLPLRGSVLTTATFLVSPYFGLQDLIWLALPIAWITKLGLQDGWLRGEREILVMAWFLPLLLYLIAKYTYIQIGPWVLLALLWVILRRAGIINRWGIKINPS